MRAQWVRGRAQGVTRASANRCESWCRAHESEGLLNDLWLPGDVIRRAAAVHSNFCRVEKVDGRRGWERDVNERSEGALGVYVRGNVADGIAQ